MAINRSNYEIWFMDWLDGNLNDLQVEHLNLFLSENPELREEFYELNTLCLKPSGKSFPQKEQLKKYTTHLPSLQFEYLCIAYLEDDLPSCQKTELKEMICNNPEREKSFELIQRIRLTPETAVFRFKKNLIKKTTPKKVIPLSVIGLTAAATIAVIILIYISIPLNHQNKLRSTATNIVADSTLSKQFVPIVSVKTLPDKTAVITKQKIENQIAAVQKKSPVIIQFVPSSAVVDSLERITNFPVIKITKVPVHADIVLIEKNERNTLVASNSIFILTEFDDGRSKLDKFIARTFREKILKEPISKDSPLKAYEIAEAGVAGLNKLLGWEMALEEKKDENGEMTSVYFSSRILKFNAPVKKTESLP